MAHQKFDSNSSNIESVEHDGSDLIVKFRKGQTYRYFEVPEGVFTELAAAEATGGSVGRLFRSLVQYDGYKYEVQA